MSTSALDAAAPRLDTRLLLFLAAATFALYFFTSGNYGIFRDELYYFANGEHLDWGYVDHPPLVAIYANLVRPLFGEWLPGLRLPATLAISAAVFLAGMITHRLGGGSYAQALAALFVIICPVYQGMSNFLSMNAFDILFWAAVVFLSIDLVQRDDPRRWLLLGVVAGLAALNKYSIFFLMAALMPMLLAFTRARKHLLTPWPYIGGAIGLIMLLPNLLWQQTHGWPFLAWQAAMTADTTGWFTPLYFLQMQVLMMHPFAAPLWIGGLLYLLFAKRMKEHRYLALAWVLALALYMLKGSKVYYPAPSYFLLFPAGALMLERFFSRPKLGWAAPVTIVLLIIGGLITLPYGLPVLPIDDFIKYDQVLRLEGESRYQDGRPIVLKQHYADRFGWEEMVKEVARVYHSLSDEEKKGATIIGNNYGNAGAIDFWRHKYQLPAAISDHMTYYIWGYGENTADVLITCGWHTREELEQGYDSVVEAGMIENPYALFYETGYPIYLCKGRKFTLKELWESTDIAY